MKHLDLCEIEGCFDEHNHCLESFNKDKLKIVCSVCCFHFYQIFPSEKENCITFVEGA